MSPSSRAGGRMVLNLPELSDEQLKAFQPHDMIPLILSMNEHIAPQALSKSVITVVFNGLLMRTTTLTSEQRAQILDSWSTSLDRTDIDNIPGITIPAVELLPHRQVRIEGLIFRFPVCSLSRFLDRTYSPKQFLDAFRSSNTNINGFHVLSPEVCQAAMSALPEYYPQVPEAAKTNFRDRVNGRKGREMLRTYAEEWAERYAVLGPFDPIEGHECTTLPPPLEPPLDPAVEEYQQRKEIRDIMLEQIREREAEMMEAQQDDLEALFLRPKKGLK